MVRVILASRSAGLLAGATVALMLPSLALGNRAVTIEISPVERGNLLPYPELCALLTAITAIVLLRPKFWEWDRVGSRRAAVVAGCSAIVAIALPMSVMAVGALRLAAEVPWSWSAANVLIYGSLTVMLTPFLGVSMTGGIMLLLYFAIGVLNNVEPAIGSQLPIATFTEPAGHWVAGSVLAVAAVAGHVWTRGATAWAHRMNP